MLTSDLADEGVVTVIPSGVLAGNRAKRYSAEDKVPLLERPFARQIGAAGYWYVLAPSLADIWDQSIDAFYQGFDVGSGAGQVINDAVNKVLPFGATIDQLAAGKVGLLDFLSSVLGIPVPVVLALLAFVGYALLQGDGLVPPLGRVFK